jgi:hypothetical protein
MAMKESCVACGHMRATHTTGIEHNDRSCFMPNCGCKEFQG